jgi:predicted ribonuclease YlaK
MFIRHDKVEEWDLAPLLRLAEDEPLHIVIPIAVIDELDRLKEASNKQTRWRARYSTAVLDRVLRPDTAWDPSPASVRIWPRTRHCRGVP